MAIFSDITSGNNSITTPYSRDITRKFVVTELSTAGYAMEEEAKVILTSNNIYIGAEHPLINATNGYNTAYIYSIECMQTPGTSNSITATASYRQFDTTTRYSISNTLESFEVSDYYTNVDTPGRSLMTVTYGSESQVYTDQRMFPVVVLMIRRTELYSLACDTIGSGKLLYFYGGGNIMIDRGITYGGKLNNSGWNLRPAASADLWLCEGITADSDDNGLSWQVTYRFKWSPIGWHTKGKYIDPETGAVPSDVVDGTGIKDFRQNLRANFSLLELS